MNLQALIALRKYLTVLSHSDGSIKLSFSLQVLSDSTAMTLIKEMKGQKMPKAILDTNLNIFARSLVLNYDTNCIVPSEFDELLTTRSRSRFEELVEKYTEVLSA